MQIATLHDLMVHELRDLYSAEQQLVKALPRMSKAATSEELQKSLQSHLAQTEQHVSRLEQIFDILGASPRGVKCKGMEGLIEEGKGLLDEDIDPEVLDAGIIAAAQRVEHYEIAAYGTVCEFARSMDHAEVVALLGATLAEEKEADEILTGLAEGGINALAARDDQEDMGSEDDNGAAVSTEKRSSRASGVSRTSTGSRRE